MAAGVPLLHPTARASKRRALHPSSGSPASPDRLNTASAPLSGSYRLGEGPGIGLNDGHRQTFCDRRGERGGACLWDSSRTSLFVRALFGTGLGDVVRVSGSEVEILRTR